MKFSFLKMFLLFFFIFSLMSCEALNDHRDTDDLLKFSNFLKENRLPDKVKEDGLNEKALKNESNAIEASKSKEVSVSNEAKIVDLSKVLQCKLCSSMFEAEFNFEKVSEDKIRALREYFIKSLCLDKTKIVEVFDKEKILKSLKDISLQYFLKGSESQFESENVSKLYEKLKVCKSKETSPSLSSLAVCEKVRLRLCNQILDYESECEKLESYENECKAKNVFKDLNMKRQGIKNPKYVNTNSIKAGDNNDKDKDQGRLLKKSKMLGFPKQKKVEKNTPNSMIVNLAKQLQQLGLNLSNNSFMSKQSSQKELPNFKEKLTTKATKSTSNLRKKLVEINNDLSLNNQDIEDTSQIQNDSGKVAKTNYEDKEAKEDDYSLLQLSPEYIERNFNSNPKTHWKPPKPILLKNFEDSIGSQLTDISQLTT